MRFFLLFLFLFSTNFLNSDEAEKSSSAILGGKAASLIKLEQVPGISVPTWFFVSTDYFKEFIDRNGITEKIDALDNDPSSPYEKAAEIRELILNGSYSKEFHQHIQNKVRPLFNETSALAVRSSSVIEDMAESSFAGVYDTFLNQKDEKSVIEAVKRCWASVFNDRAVFERNRNGIAHKKALIAVIVQQMVDAEVAGTAFTMEIGTGYDGIEIVANYGLGESVVEGEVTADKWLVHSKTHHIIKSTLGSKIHKVSSDNGASGTLTVELSDEERNQYVMSPETVKQIAVSLQKIASYYQYPHLDTEFAISKTGKLYFLQARSLVSVPVEDLKVIDINSAENKSVIAKGRYSVPGAITGQLKVIESFEKLASGEITIGADDIVVTYVSTNKWSQYMTNFKGMITQEGGPTSHPILLCRERKVPCVIGIQPDTFVKLLQLDGATVTLDGLNQTIYAGELKLKQATQEDFKTRFNVIEQEEIPSSSEQIQNFKDYNLLMVEKTGEKESFWQKKPAYSLDPLMQELNLLGYDKRALLLGIDSFPSDAKVLNDHVVERFMTDQEKLQYYAHMDVGDAEKFVDFHERTLTRYKELTASFVMTKANWQEYVDLMSTLRAYIWLGYNFRLYANNQAALIGNELQVPKFYVEAYTAQLQNEAVEEDTLMIHDIARMATKLQPFSDMSLKQLEKDSPSLYFEMVKLARSYRFQDNLAFKTELDLGRVHKRVLNEIKNLGVDYEHVEGIKHDYFPEDMVLKRWLAVAIRNRILQSDTHHVIIRGQWNVRDELLKLGKGHDIFNHSVEEIGELID